MKRVYGFIESKRGQLVIDVATQERSKRITLNAITHGIFHVLFLKHRKEA
jgi:hypothetical protein